MIETEYGKFDGDKWEKICQICFKRKYEEECYIEVIASPGDFGIEGFTRTGKVFQCYCPDYNYTRNELYDNHRDKITEDLKKLKTFEKDLKRRLGDTKIKRWYFVTPEFSKNEIVAHCTKKTAEVKSWNLKIIDNNDFEVLPYDIDFLHPQLTLALDATGQKLSISPSAKINQSNISKYRDSQSYLVDNALEKHQKRLEQRKSDISKVDNLTDKTIKHFLRGQVIIERWKNVLPEQYEKFKEIIEREEEEVEENCFMPSSDFQGDYQNIKSSTKNILSQSFNSLDALLITDLTNYVIADWVLRCPLNFVEVKSE